MIKTRYKFLKKIHRDYVMVFLIKSNCYVFYEDMFILSFKKGSLSDTLENCHINYVVIDNLDIIKKRNFEDNRYYEFCWKSLFISLLTS